MIIKNCFLEGDSLVGKSTLIQKCLLTSGASVSGFYVARRKDVEGKITGFELRDSQELLEPEQPRILRDDHCFMTTYHGKRMRNLVVFEEYGKNLLLAAQESTSQIILLDEIGGIELLVPGFTKELMKLIAQPRKILGVFKSDKNYQNMQRSKQHSSTIDEKRLALRQQICLNNEGQIIELKETNRNLVAKKLQLFLEG